MSRHYGLPVQVEADATTGEPCRLTWRGITHRVEVIGRWHLMTRWWDVERQTDRHYFRLVTPDLRLYEVYREASSGGLWVLDKVLD